MIDWAAVASGFGGAFVEDDDKQVHGIVPAIAAELVRTGIIYQSAGRWRIANANRAIIQGPRSDLAVCDFCSGRPVVFDADATDFLDGLQGRSVGAWAACAPCGQMVARRDRAGLLDRVLHHRAEVVGPPAWQDDPVRVAALRTMIDGFWAHYTGVLTPVAPRPFGH